MVTKSEPTVMSADSTVASDALEVFLAATGVMQKRGWRTTHHKAEDGLGFKIQGSGFRV